MDQFKTSLIDFHTHNRNAGPGAIINLLPGDANEIKAGFFYSIGLHPWYIREDEVEWQLEQIRNVATMPEVIAIGEAGLDKLAVSDFKLQQFIFQEQISIAEALKKPLIIHSVRSYNEMVQIKTASESTVPWVVHGFNSNIRVAEMLIDHGFCLSFGKALLNPKTNATRVLNQVDQGKVFLETDDSEVKIEEIYKIAARLLKSDFDPLKSNIYRNFIKCLGIKNG